MRSPRSRGRKSKASLEIVPPVPVPRPLPPEHWPDEEKQIWGLLQIEWVIFAILRAIPGRIQLASA